MHMCLYKHTRKTTSNRKSINSNGQATPSNAIKAMKAKRSAPLCEPLGTKNPQIKPTRDM